MQAELEVARGRVAETGAGRGGGEAGERLARVQAELEVARGRVAAQAAALGLGLDTPAARLDSRSRSLEAEQRNKDARWVASKLYFWFTAGCNIM